MSPTEDTVGRGTRGATTRAALIRATVEVVREVGYAHATTRAIAQRAGVAEGTIYRHFPDKAALFFAAVLEGHAAELEGLAGLLERAGGASVAETLAEALGRLASLQGDVLPLELALRTDPELAARRQQTTAALQAGQLVGAPQLIADYLRAEQRLGRVRADVPAERMAVVLLATIFGIALAWSGPDAPIDVAVLREAVVLFVQGIETGAPESPRGHGAPAGQETPGGQPRVAPRAGR